jgi:serpin B
LFLILFSCRRDFSTFSFEKQVRELTTYEKSLTQSDNTFGLKLFREIIREEPDSNIFISPLSVAMALSMTLNGAANETEIAMRNTLELNGLSKEQINRSFKGLIELLTELDPEVIFQIANSIWYRLGFQVEQDFIDVNKKYFNAIVQSLDFTLPEALDIINTWVEENTNKKINKIIDQIHPLTVMFLINAIYFKGTWTYEFDKDLTQDDTFFMNSESSVNCKLMRQTGEFLYLETSEFQAVDLPYGSGKYSMTIFLPYSSKPVNSLIEELTVENLDSWIAGLSKTEGTIFLPKFKLEYEIKLNDVLTALGMGIAFSEAADFTGINRYGGLFISKVKHKTFVEVDEEGTEAAAVTVVEIRESAVQPSTFMMKVNRPFIFIIRENHSGTILFSGKIVEP